MNTSFSQSYLLIGESSKQDEFVTSFVAEKKINTLDVSTAAFEKPLGIADVRAIQKTIFLKPLKSESKLVAIKAPDATTEAQNALLKVLEEPPKDTYIFLLLPNQEHVLPTVLSRCTLISFSNEREQIISNAEELFDSLKNMGIGEKLALAQEKGKTREEALAFIQDLLHAGRVKIIKDRNPEDAKSLQKVLQALKDLKTTNVSPRFCLEVLFLDLNPHS